MRLIVLLAFVGSIFAQTKPESAVQHAPTAEQCRADQRLWDSQFVAWSDAVNNGHHFSSPLGQLDMTELLSRRSEMQDCEAVNPTSLHDYRTMYYYLSTIIADHCITYFLTTGKVTEYIPWETEQRRK
jgi:hypothetical protein